MGIQGVGRLVLVSVLVVVGGCSLLDRDSGGAKIGPDGGRVRSKDGVVTLVVGRGQASDGTSVTVAQDVDGPPPPAMVQPLSRPFDIGVDGSLTSGTVSVRYRLPSGVRPEALVMVIEDGDGWRTLPTTVDASTSTMTAQWPHFSKGYPAFWNPGFRPITPKQVLTGTADAIGWSWDKVKAGANWAKDQGTEAVNAIADGVVAVAGGTRDSASCSPASPDWTFTKSTGMTGCASPRSGDPASWQVRVNDRFPHPLLVRLPRGVLGPGWRDLPESTGIVDKVLSMIMSRGDAVLVPGGGNTVVRLLPQAGDSVDLKAVTDPFSLAVRTAALLAAYYSRGYSTEAEAALGAQVAAADARLLAAQKARSTVFTRAEHIAETQGENGLLAMRTKALANSRHADRVAELFDYVDFVDCANGLRSSATTLGEGDIGTAYNEALDTILDKCFPQYAKLVVQFGMNEALKKLDPTERRRQDAALTKSLLSQALEIRRLVSVALATRLSALTGGNVDLLTADVRATQTLSAGGLPDTALAPDGTFTCPPPGALALPGARGAVRCRWVVHLDLDGNTKPDEVVLWRTENSRGAIAVTDDGVVHPLKTAVSGRDYVFSWDDELGTPTEIPGRLESATPQNVFTTSSGRQVLGVNLDAGAHNTVSWLLGLDDGGKFTVAVNPDDPNTAFEYLTPADDPTCQATGVVFTAPLRVGGC